jgi:hypothetical protein
MGERTDGGHTQQCPGDRRAGLGGVRPRHRWRSLCELRVFDPRFERTELRQKLRSRPGVWSLSAPLLISYAVGCFVWLGYAINRFCDADAMEFSGQIIEQFCLALVWPFCVVAYLPYRIFRWLGVRWGA